MTRWIGRARLLAFLILIAGVIGFGGYAGEVASHDPPAASVRADGIVALTGDSGRLSAAVSLLENGQAGQLLISGVNPDVSEAALRNASGLDDQRFDCCVTLGREARDTVGNAVEAAAWAQARGYDRLIVVTSDYHLPRALLEMRARLPETELIAYPVDTAPPWRNPGAARLWLLEYAKYVAVLGRETLSPDAS